MKVAIIDYGMGNVASVEKALSYLGISSKLTRSVDEIRQASFILLPGVGAFSQGMKHLNDLGLVEILNEQVISEKKPFLGICLGMQLIADFGYEPSKCAGLGWIKGEVIRIDNTNKSIPHLGWNNITAKANSILSDFDKDDFYFIHSYHFKVANRDQVIATVDYEEEYVAGVQSENIFAVQFHPEKSQSKGLALLKKFFEHYA